MTRWMDCGMDVFNSNKNPTMTASSLSKSKQKTPASQPKSQGGLFVSDVIYGARCNHKSKEKPMDVICSSLQCSDYVKQQRPVALDVSALFLARILSIKHSSCLPRNHLHPPPENLSSLAP